MFTVRRITFATLALASFALILPATAEVLVSWTDPEGDPNIYPVGDATAPYDHGTDLVALAFVMTEDRWEAHVTVTDLSKAHENDGVPRVQNSYFIQWHQEGNGKDGSWDLNAHYLPDRDEPWAFSGEGPCLDGKDSDGCPGELRDIYDELPGRVDEANNTVIVELPYDILDPQATMVFSDFYGSAQNGWPAYPITTVDFANEPTGFTASFPRPKPVAGSPSAEESTTTAPWGTTSGSTGAEQPVEPGQETTTVTVTTAPDGSTHTVTTVIRNDAPSSSTPAGGVVLAATAFAAALVGVRRNSAR